MRILIVFLVLTFVSCKKAEDRTCMKFNGKDIEKTIPVDDFLRLRVGAYLDFVLVQDTVCYVKLIGGEKVLNLVDIKSHSNTLELLNKNKCRFLRNKKKVITAEIHFKQLEDIFFEGSGTMSNVGQLNLPYLTIALNEASGTINLNLESEIINISAEPSWANYILKGHTKHLNMTVKGNSYADVLEMTIDSLLTVKSRSSADVYINVESTGFFKCETWGDGNVYYSGTPAYIEWNNYGVGELLKYD